MQKSAEWYNKQQTGVGERFLYKVVSSFKLIQANQLHYEEIFKKIQVRKLAQFFLCYCV